MFTPVKVPCTSSTTVQVGGVEHKLEHYSDQVKRYFKVGISTVYSTPELAKIDKEWQVYCKHVDKRQYSVVYRKCEERGCGRCSQHPIECRDVLRSLPQHQ